MKPLLLPLLACLPLVAALPARAQEPDPQVVYLYSAPQLDQLAGPIALYPDPLVAVILPAATTPQDVAAAAAYAFGSGDPRYADEQPWSNSVKALVHYRPVLQWMAQNLSWTQALGAAFASEPGGVMQAIQRVRHQARAEGVLVSTPQQIVFEQDGEIQILPGEPDVIYVPLYDPAILWGGGYNSSYVRFGEGYPAGPWLGFGLDWRSSALVAGDWRLWHERGGWRRGAFAPPPGTRVGAPHRWQPPPRPAAPAGRPAQPPAFHVRPPSGAPVPPGRGPRGREEFPRGVGPQPHLEHRAEVPPREAPREPALPPAHADATRLPRQPDRPEFHPERRAGEPPRAPGAPHPGGEHRSEPPGGRPAAAHPAAAPHPPPAPEPHPAPQPQGNASGGGDGHDRR
ncbi:MAG TPA: DUF3300 domain-containing protein [Opitutaceae bacterium]|nr:DUF3300 domain-containing protein [Opitutaceae bacterium]